MRWFLLLIAGVLLGGIVHLVSILWLPGMASRNAYARLAPLAPVNAVALLPQPTPESAVLPFMDPAFATAVCRFDLAQGPIKLQMHVSPAYASASFYTPTGTAFYAINDRAAGRRVVELELMNAAQRGQVEDNEEEVTAADRLIVESPTDTGIILLRALATEPGAMPATRGLLSAARCQTQALPPQ